MAEPSAQQQRTSIAVIGFSGRRVAGQLLTRELYDSMVGRIERYVTDLLRLDWQNVRLVSGGAAWADHIAVTLFAAHPEAQLVLYMPCSFDVEHARFSMNGVNVLHKDFTDAVGFSSLQQLSDAQARGATFDTSSAGFLERNVLVAAAADHLVALTWSRGDQPEARSGTLHTWNRFKRMNKKHNPVHMPMSSCATEVAVMRKRRLEE